MPPKLKFTEQHIVNVAVTIVRNRGWSGLTTRSLADELGSSARPIYSFFNSMADLEEKVVKTSVDILYDYMTRGYTGDPWHDHGIGYVMFAVNQKQLFRSITDENHIALFKKYGDVIWADLTNLLSDYPPFNGLTGDQIFQIQLHRWLFAHGLAFSASNPPPDTWTPETVITIMQSGSKAIYRGLVEQFKKLEKDTDAAPRKK